MRRRPVHRVVLTRCVVRAGLLALLVALVGCDARQTPDPDEQPAAADGPTIVSLTPAVTQMLIDMGKRDQIVGVSSDDDPGLKLTACGTYRDPVLPRILEVEPALVITESSRPDGSDVPPMLRTLADKGAFELAVIPHSRSIADIERALTDKDTGLGRAVGDPEAAERARALMAARLELVQAVIADAPRPRVLMLINPATLGAIGTGVTHDELLALAGGINAAADYNAGYLTLTRAQIQQDLRPDVILILEPNGTPIRGNDPRLRALQGMTVPAVTNNRVAVIRHPHAMLPCTAMPGVLVEMACAIHPERAQTIRSSYELAERFVDDAKAGDGGRP